MSKKMFIAVVVCVVGMLSPLALGAVNVDDHFDDGVVDTNTGGIGTGFNFWDIGWNATVTEADSKIILNGPTHGGSRCSMTSKEGAVLGGGLSRFEFKGVSFAVGNTGTGATARNCIGVKQGNETWDFDGGLPTGFWVQFENTSLTTANGSGGWNGTSVLFYEAIDNTKTVLATWTFDTLNWNAGTQNLTPILDITLDISADGYEMVIEGDTITLLSGSLAGTFAGAGFTNEVTEGFCDSLHPSENPGINILIDQIIITENVPTKIMLDAPAHNAIYVPLDQQLSWIVVDENVTNIDLYFDADPNFLPSSRRLTGEPATTTSWNPGGLDYSMTWYWRVDAYELQYFARRIRYQDIRGGLEVHDRRPVGHGKPGQPGQESRQCGSKHYPVGDDSQRNLVAVVQG
jgi:hypothetical protein